MGGVEGAVLGGAGAISRGGVASTTEGCGEGLAQPTRKNSINAKKTDERAAIRPPREVPDISESLGRT